MVFISITLMMLEDELFLESIQKLMHAAIMRSINIKKLKKMDYYLISQPALGTLL